MSAPLTGLETAEELLFLGAALAHVADFRERQRRARIDRSAREAVRLHGLRAGTLGLAPVVVRGNSVGA